MRIIMGTAYCLQHMHGMNPPMAHTDFNSSEIYLTDDYAAKVCSKTLKLLLKVLLLSCMCSRTSETCITSLRF